MTSVSYHETVEELQAQSWPHAGPFATPGWFSMLQQHGRQPLLAEASDADGFAILPLERDRRSLRSLTNWYAFTWRPVMQGCGSEAAINAICRDLKGMGGRIDLTRIPDEDGSASTLARAMRNSGWLVWLEENDVNHILRPARRSFDEYLAARPGQLRTTLKRKAGKLDIRLSQCFVAEEWAIHEEIYAGSWKPAEGDPRFLRAFAERESKAGHYLLAIASKDERPLATQFWTVQDGVAYIHKLAHRPDAARHSPGSVLTAALLRHVFEEANVDLIDFGTGDESYKRDWMEEVRPRYALTCLDPARAANWPSIIRRTLRGLVSHRSAG